MTPECGMPRVGCGQDIDRLFSAYCDAMRRAQASLRIEDGIAAGHAWRAFMAAIARPKPQKPMLRVVK